MVEYRRINSWNGLVSYHILPCTGWMRGEEVAFSAKLKRSTVTHLNHSLLPFHGLDGNITPKMMIT